MQSKLAAVLVLSVGLATHAAEDVSGVWDLEMFWPNDIRSTGVCTLEEDAQKLTGECGGTEKFPIAGDVKDRKVSFELEAEQGGHKAKMTFSGEIDDAATSIRGSCRIAGGQEGTFTMKRR